MKRCGGGKGNREAIPRSFVLIIIIIIKNLHSLTANDKIEQGNIYPYSISFRLSPCYLPLNRLLETTLFSSISLR